MEWFVGCRNGDGGGANRRGEECSSRQSKDLAEVGNCQIILLECLAKDYTIS